MTEPRSTNAATGQQPLRFPRSERRAIAALHLDRLNPRLPAEEQAGDRSELDIAAYIERHYDALNVAESIAEHIVSIALSSAWSPP